MTALDLATRLLLASHDEWDISEESRALAADALAALKAAEAAARGAAFREREAANEAAMLRARLATAQEEAGFWRMQMECAGPLVDAMRALQRRFCPKMPGSVCRADEVLAAIGAQVDALTAEVARLTEAMRRQAAAVRTLDASRAERDAYEARTLRSLAGVARAALLAELDEARRERDDWNARATALESECDALRAQLARPTMEPRP